MNNFWSLVGFEYKKIFVRKSVLIALLLEVAILLFVTTLLGGLCCGICSQQLAVGAHILQL